MVLVWRLAPARTPALLVQNLRMAEAFGQALAVRPVAHVVYASSDASMPTMPPGDGAVEPPAGSLHGT